MKRWQIFLFLALTLLSLVGCAAGDGSYTGAPEQRPTEYDSPRP
jgi:hypothetical protein